MLNWIKEASNEKSGKDYYHNAVSDYCRAATLVGWWFFGRVVPLPDGLIQANGRIEGDHYIVAGKVSERIIKLGAREGDSVKKGQIMAQLDDAQMNAKVTQAKAAVEASKTRFSAAQIKLEILKKDVPLKIDTAKADVSHAKAQLVAAKAGARQAGRDAARMKTLLKEGAVEKHRSEEADLAWTAKRSGLITAQEALKRNQNSGPIFFPPCIIQRLLSAVF